MKNFAYTNWTGIGSTQWRSLVFAIFTWWEIFGLIIQGSVSNYMGGEFSLCIVFWSFDVDWNGFSLSRFFYLNKQMMTVLIKKIKQKCKHMGILPILEQYRWLICCGFHHEGFCWLLYEWVKFNQDSRLCGAWMWFISMIWVLLVERQYMETVWANLIKICLLEWSRWLVWSEEMLDHHNAAV